VQYIPSLSPDEKEAIQSFKVMLNEIATVKEKHDRPALRPDGDKESLP
jgi:hypothetical protein